MRFTQFLIETRDQPAPFNWVTKSTEQWTAIFNIGELSYRVIFEQDDEIKSKWEVVFILSNRPKDTSMYELTGTGNAFVVFSTVKHIIVDFVSQHHHISTIGFSAQESSRKRFYDRWASDIATLIGWNLKVIDRGVRKYYLKNPKLS